MRRLALSVVVVLCGVGQVEAGSFGTGANQFTIDFVPILGSTNPTDTSLSGGYGIVAYDYRMGVYEITNDQWDKFKASLGVPVTGDPSSAYNFAPYWTGTNVPITGVSWYEAAQMVNWLNTDTGHHAAYNFTGTQGTPDYALDIWSPAEAAGGTNLYRHKDAFYFLPTEDEWVKAAYWNGATLQDYATKDNSDPVKWRPTGGPNSDGQAAGWNYNWFTDQPWDIIAGYSPEELNGTYDMMGNVWEWMESPWDDPNYVTGSDRGLRGGSFYCYGFSYLHASYCHFVDPSYEFTRVGFRVASIAERYPGDANLDGVTDVRDFNIWNANKFTNDTDWASGDFDGNGVTDVRDFNQWNAAKFTSATDGPPLVEGQVPEPSTIVLLCMSACGLVAYAWRRRAG